MSVWLFDLSLQRRVHAAQRGCSTARSIGGARGRSSAAPDLSGPPHCKAVLACAACKTCHVCKTRSRLHPVQNSCPLPPSPGTCMHARGPLLCVVALPPLCFQGCLATGTQPHMSAW